MGGRVGGDQVRDEVQQAADGVDRPAVRRPQRVRHPVEGPEVQRGRVQKKQSLRGHAGNPGTIRPWRSSTDRILALLAREGRMSYTDIGRETGLSTSAAQQRVRRLEQRGVIKGYRAVLDAAELGLMVTAFVAIKPFDPSQPDDAPERLQHIEEIVSCYSVAGRAQLPAQGAGPDDERPGVAAGPDPRRRQGLDPHHHRALGAVRGPTADLSDAHPPRPRRPGTPGPARRAGGQPGRPRRHRVVLHERPGRLRRADDAAALAASGDAPRSTSAAGWSPPPSSTPTCTASRPARWPTVSTCTTPQPDRRAGAGGGPRRRPARRPGRSSGRAGTSAAGPSRCRRRRAELDRAAPGVAVYLARVDVHSARRLQRPARAAAAAGRADRVHARRAG